VDNNISVVYRVTSRRWYGEQFAHIYLWLQKKLWSYYVMVLSLLFQSFCVITCSWQILLSFKHNDSCHQVNNSTCFQTRGPKVQKWMCLYMYMKSIYFMWFWCRPSCSWSYGSWIYNYLLNQYLSPLKLWVLIPLRRGVLDTTLLLRQVGGFLRVLRFPPPIKLTATILLKYCRMWR